MLPTASHVIETPITLGDGETLDGHGQTYTLPGGWDFAPISAVNVTGATIRNLSIVAPPDNLGGVTGIINLQRTKKVRLENVTIQAAGRRDGTPNKGLPLIIWETQDTLVENSAFSYSPHWNVEASGNDRLTLRRVDAHHGHFDGIKLATANTDTLIDNCWCHDNGHNGGVGDGIDFCHGAARCDIVNTKCNHNTNGITFKYGPWNPGGSDDAPRVPCYGVKIRGGSLSHNDSSGLFAQGFSGKPPAGVEGDSAPWPMTFSVSDVVAENNTNHGFLVGAGTWTFRGCLAYRNQQHGFYISDLARDCHLSDCDAIANLNANFNIWAKRTDLTNCKAFGVDVFNTPANNWKNAVRVSQYGINLQWKPVRGGDHGVFRRVINKFSIHENDKPKNLPPHHWEDEPKNGPAARSAGR